MIIVTIKLNATRWTNLLGHLFNAKHRPQMSVQSNASSEDGNTTELKDLKFKRTMASQVPE